MPLGCPSTNAIAQAWASRPKFITDTHSICFRALSQHQTQAIELCSKWLLLPTGLRCSNTRKASSHPHSLLLHSGFFKILLPPHHHHLPGFMIFYSGL